jgi:hypothetical protein
MITVSPELQELIADYCYRAYIPYPADDKMLKETVDRMSQLGYVSFKDVEALQI